MDEFKTFDDADVAAGDGATHAPEVESVEKVRIVPADGTVQETAQALLDAAESLELNLSVVEFSDGHFYVPQDVADAASVPESSAADGESEDGNADDDKPKHAPAKRAPVKAAAK